MGQVVLAVDVGTGSVRAALVDEELRVAAMAARDYPMQVPRVGWGEQDPDSIWSATVESIREVLQKARAGAAASAAAASAAAAARGDILPDLLVFDSVLHSLVGLDSEGRPVTPVLTWADLRAADECRELAARLSSEDFYFLTGCPLHPLYLPPKIMWFRRNDPGAWERVATWSSVKGFVLRRLTGVVVEDLSVASGSGLLDIRRLAWCTEVLEAAGIPAASMPRLAEPTEVIGTVCPDVADLLGVRRGMSVMVGAADGPVANLGAGSVGPGQMAVTIGTSGALRVLTDMPRLDLAGRRTWCYYLADRKWVAGAAVNNGGNVIDWFRQNVAGVLGGDPASHQDILGLADGAPAGADGLVFLPFLAGERSPGWNPHASGVLLGLTLKHDARHICRALVEGVVHQMKACYDGLSEVAGEPEEVRLTGGASRSPLWQRLICDMIGRPLALPTEAESSLIGSAGLAAVRLGRIPDLGGIRERVTLRGSLIPDPEANRVMARAHFLYRRAYELMTTSWTRA